MSCCRWSRWREFLGQQSEERVTLCLQSAFPARQGGRRTTTYRCCSLRLVEGARYVLGWDPGKRLGLWYTVPAEEEILSSSVLRCRLWVAVVVVVAQKARQKG